MADDVELASQNEEAFRQHPITNHQEEELPLTGRCYNCEDNDTKVCKGIIRKLLEENEHLRQEVRRLERICY